MPTEDQRKLEVGRSLQAAVHAAQRIQLFIQDLTEGGEWPERFDAEEIEFLHNAAENLVRTTQDVWDASCFRGTNELN